MGSGYESEYLNSPRTSPMPLEVNRTVTLINAPRIFAAPDTKPLIWSVEDDYIIVSCYKNISIENKRGRGGGGEHCLFV